MPVARQDSLPEVGFQVALVTRHPPSCSQGQIHLPVQLLDRPNQASCAWVLATGIATWQRDFISCTRRWRAAARRAFSSNCSRSFGPCKAFVFALLLAGSTDLRGRGGWRKRLGVGIWRMRADAASALMVSDKPK